MPSFRSFSLAAIAPLALTLGLAACGDDNGVGPEPITQSTVAGSYEATTLDVTIGGETTDELAGEAALSLNLAANGSTSGRLFVPEGDEDGSDLEASLAGTWTFDDSTREVEFEHEADTFVRDMTFRAARGPEGLLLAGTETFDEATVEVVLARQ